jgi:hypothetical protein
MDPADLSVGAPLPTPAIMMLPTRQTIGLAAIVRKDIVLRDHVLRDNLTMTKGPPPRVLTPACICPSLHLFWGPLSGFNDFARDVQAMRISRLVRPAAGQLDGSRVGTTKENGDSSVT